MKKLIFKLRESLKEAVEKNKADVLLFSGGLDTSILAVLAPEITGINISLEEYSLDIEYARIVEKFLKMKVYYQKIKIEEAISTIPEIIKILKSFDPAIPNDIAVYFGIKFAKKLKFKNIMTGDGADELFAGYDYMKDIKDLDKYIEKISENLYFSSNKLGNFFKVEIKQPFINEKFKELSLKIPKELKIKKENGEIFGKWILRKAFETLLPKKVIWQSKRPLEYGSGMTELRRIITSKISDKEFERKKKKYPVKFLNKEHLYYYEIYRKVVGEIPPPQNNESPCPYCGAGVKNSSFHCSICGGVLIEVLTKIC